MIENNLQSTREERRHGEAKEEPHEKYFSKIARRSCAKRDAVPEKDGTGYVSRRAKSSENYVARDLAEEISNEL